MSEQGIEASNPEKPRDSSSKHGAEGRRSAGSARTPLVRHRLPSLGACRLSCRARAPGLRSSVLPAAPRWPHKKEGAATGTCLGVEARLTHVARLSPHELFLKSRVHKVLLGLGGAGRGTEQLVTCHHTPSWRWRRRSGNGGRPGHGGTTPLPTNTPRIVAAVSTGTPAPAAAWRHGRRPSHWPTSAVATGPRTVGPPSKSSMPQEGVCEALGGNGERANAARDLECCPVRAPPQRRHPIKGKRVVHAHVGVSRDRRNRSRHTARLSHALRCSATLLVPLLPRP